MLNVFLVTVLASSLFSSLESLLANPGSALDLFGISIPASSTFFLNYILLLALVSPALELLQIARLVVPMLGFAKTPREKALQHHAPVYSFELAYAGHGFIAFLGLAFTPIAPLVPAATTFYFFANYLVLSNNISRVYKTPKVQETNGLFHLKAVRLLLVSIGLADLIACAMFVTKRAWIAAGIIGVVGLLLLLAVWLGLNGLEFIDSEQEIDAVVYQHPCLEHELKGVWVDQESEFSGAVVEAGISRIDSDSLLKFGFGQEPDVLA